MNKRIHSLMLLTLLFIGMLTLAFNVQLVKASGAIYIRADGSIEPPTVNITTADNVTYAFTGNIYDEIVVERSNIIIDGKGYTLQGNGSGTGIDLSGEENVTVWNIQIKSFGYGIWLGSSNYNNIIGNNVTANTWFEIYLNSSSNNCMIRNNITASNSGGIALVDSSSNSIYHNNIIDNANQVYDYSWDHPEILPSINTWDDGYPSGGNYWSDYTGVDLYSGPYQNETGSDGIGDIPYVIDENNQDNYPLVQPYIPLLGDLNDDGKVDGQDLFVIASTFGSYPEHLRWNPEADLNGDNRIDGQDIYVICINFGRTTPQPPLPIQA